MDKEFMEALQDRPVTKRKNFHLHRRIFLLVFAIAIMLEGLLFVDSYLQHYYADLKDSFKIIFTVEKTLSNDDLSKIGESLNQKKDISSVKLFSPADGLEVVRAQNPQLAENMLLMGKNHMPAYFEVHVIPSLYASIEPFVDNVLAEQKLLSAHYSVEHASLASYVGLSAKLLRLVLVFSAIILLLFMFFVEAYPVAEERSYALGGVVSGILACVCAGLFYVILLYPSGVLSGTITLFTTWGRQVLIVVLGGLLGWTLSKWQRF